MPVPVLQTIIASTRPGRVGLPVGRWFHEHARAHGAFDAELIDLAEVALPFVDEPNHPRMRRYTHQHTKDWSASVDHADAFVFVVPEYNHSMPATIKNALDFVLHEWAHKPLGFVSYGGVSAGLRCVLQLKQPALAVGLVPVATAVSIPFVQQFLSEQRDSVNANEQMEEAAQAMLDELARMEGIYRPLRERGQG